MRLTCNEDIGSSILSGGTKDLRDWFNGKTKPCQGLVESSILSFRSKQGAMPRSDNPYSDMHKLAKNNLSCQAYQIDQYKS